MAHKKKDTQVKRRTPTTREPVMAVSSSMDKTASSTALDVPGHSKSFQPRRKTHRPNGLMDLPTELRLLIAEYVCELDHVQSRDASVWIGGRRTEGMAFMYKLPPFRRIAAARPLLGACKQLRAEVLDALRRVLATDHQWMQVNMDLYNAHLKNSAARRATNPPALDFTVASNVYLMIWRTAHAEKLGMRWPMTLSDNAMSLITQTQMWNNRGQLS